MFATGEATIDKYKFLNISDWLHKGDATRESIVKNESPESNKSFLKIVACAVTAVAALACAVVFAVVKKKKSNKK